MKKNVVLIGMPGAGKSTIGVILAKMMGKDFIDADLVIQKEEGLLLKDIIKRDGPDGFLAVENRVNAGLNPANAVIATGGSAVNGKEDMLERVRYERRVEFCLEGINFFDEVRWGTYKETKFQGKDVNGGKSWWGDMVEYNWYYTDYMWPWTAPIVETQKNPNLTKRSGWAY